MMTFRRCLALLVVSGLSISIAFAQTKETARNPPSSQTEQELTELEHQWVNAFLHGDVAALERIVAPEFIATDSAGNMGSRAEDIADMKAGAYKFESATLQSVKVHVFGDSAVITTRESISATYKGKDISGTYAYTDTFIKRDGRWQAVATHSSKVR